ncbi:riboflavin synthase [Corynebacterium aquilae]|uniref:Riboflavin synthase n=1 Tax=Corynebacterium aquilae DSM 44791 TaxID=1431546 RepID=A0A1L7CG29_9CORY|nr:riboflavin synthase [Corynebacterium aquilae]APT84821.1 riboflavin synthase subunit alpha [Corynebacterium aquilae DSM 44791]
MFTGIVEEKGVVKGVEKLGDSVRLTVGATTVLDDASHGDSIAVNGVCLTVADKGEGWFAADCMQETLDRSSLGELAVGDPVNLERAARVDSRLGGHIVQGHVDTRASLISRSPSEHWDVVRFSLDPTIARYVVEKGSITVSGTSLTVSAVGDDFFEVSLIPVTLEETILGDLQPGDTVNIEVDIIGKYVERLLAAGTRESESK